MELNRKDLPFQGLTTLLRNVVRLPGDIPMIERSFEEAFPPEWINKNITDPTNELVVLRQIIPWQMIIDKLVQFYDSKNGRIGKSLRTMVAIIILSKLRQLSDREIINQVKENRYMQYFCNVSDEELMTFLNPSTLCVIRKRLGEKGVAIIEEHIFSRLERAGIIDKDTMLMDSTVLESNIIYPNDVRLIHSAFNKMEIFTEAHQISPWWDQDQLKKRWRAFGLAKKDERATYLAEFYMLFAPALETFQIHVESLEVPQQDKDKSRNLLELLTILDVQTQQKLAGEKHIENRIVSLDEIDARPIKKGKSYPSCEFGTTLQMSFNRQGFMITSENFIGKPDDKALYAGTLELFLQRMRAYPGAAITDLGFRSRNNLKNTPEAVKCVFMGRSDDVSEDRQDFCRKARSATEGFIAVAKNLRGFGRSLYRGLKGDRVWTLLCQAAYNLKKFLQLYREEAIEEKCLVKLGLIKA